MPQVPRRVAALVCVAALMTVAGCSSSGPGASDGTTTSAAVTPLTTASRERVRAVGALHIAIVKRALAAERDACGANGIAPAPESADRCRRAMAGLSTAAHNFARALVFLRPAPDLEAIVADSIDAARPVIDTVRVYPATACLGATPPSASVRVTRCVPAGRDVAEVIAQLEQILDRWKAELGVGS